ncbi:MAG: caspase family protein [Tenuifilaceae bacterium]
MKSMKSLRYLSVIFILSLLFINNLYSQTQEKRIALIIGNSNYVNGGALKNPVNDANLMANTLQGLGFKVIKITNGTKDQMNKAIYDFSLNLLNHNIALFYYAGHGIQINGENYLIPIDAKLDNPISTEFEAIAVNKIVKQFENYPNNLNIVILDACRDNPFRTWSRGGNRGFKAIQAPAGTIISFATREGETADDGSGNNGLFTEQLVKQMKKPIQIEDVFKNTRIEVLKLTNNKQSPQEWSMLTGNFLFSNKDYYQPFEEIKNESNITSFDPSNTILSKSKYFIKVNIDGIKDTTLLLGYHLGDKKYVQDTAKVDSYGNAFFYGDSALKGGIYLVILPSKTYFEILISDNQKFGVKTSSDKLIEKLSFTNSAENSAFADYQRYMIEQEKLIKEKQEKYKKVNGKPDSIKIVQNEIKEINSKVMGYFDNVIKSNPNTLLAAIVKTMKSTEMPDFQIPAGTKNVDSLKWVMSYKFNKDHFFDNFPLTDSRFIRTPILEGRLNAYFDRVLIPSPDSITPEAIRIIETSKANKEVFQYVLSFLVNKFQTSNIMGFDAIFVALAEKYYLSGQAWWADKKLIEKIQERVTALKPNLIGNQCPDLALPDMSGKIRKISDIKTKITIIYFWDSSCSHCKKVTPELKKAYDKFKSKGLEVYGVYTQGNQPEVVDYIKKYQLTWINVWDPTFSSNFRNLFDIYSTPVIYVLDAKKKIIAKRISEESLNSMLEHLLK